MDERDAYAILLIAGLTAIYTVTCYLIWLADIA